MHRRQHRQRSKPYHLGIDESGTGAWAGPFTVAGIVVPLWHPELKRLHKKGLVNDSKKMSDAKRRKALNLMVDAVLFGKVVVVTPDRIREMRPRPAWRWAIGGVLEQIRVGLGIDTLGSKVDVVLDGPVDKQLRASYPWIRFIPKADSTVPAVSAASILAKTVRNNLMIELGKQYPEFGFAKHSGYGTDQHKAELRKHGETVDHRPIRSMKKYTTKVYVP